MLNCKWTAGLLAMAITANFSGCASHSAHSKGHAQTGESVVLAGETPAHLAHAPDLSKTVAVRSTYRDGLTNTVHYEPGRDYMVAASGEISRTAQSRIPDYATNVLYGKEDFDHGKFPGHGNKAFFVYVEYVHPEPWHPAVVTNLGAVKLPKARQKLQQGEPLKIVAYGDSITTGGETSEPALIFWERWADALRRKYPRSAIQATNGATGGDTTVQGLQRLQTKVLDQKPDVVLIGFGMNDHNRPGYGVPLDAFTANLKNMVDQIRTNTGAEIILFSTFPPNPKWHYGTHNMEAYANATQQVAQEKGCAFVDVYHSWTSIADRKKPEDILANNINHPNDFGHWIYFQAFEGIDL